MKIEVDFVGANKELSKPIEGYYKWEGALFIEEVDGWYLPTIEELKDIWEEANVKKIFPFKDAKICWSSSNCKGFAYYAMRMNLKTGYANDSSKNSTYEMRMMRDR